MLTTIDMMVHSPPHHGLDLNEPPAGPRPTAPTATRLRAARAEDESAVRELLTASGLQPHFHVDQFVVAIDGDTLVGCGRLRPLADGSFEIASVAIAPTHRGKGLGGRVVTATLAKASGRVYGLSLVPEFLARYGFQPIAGVPELLRERADGACSCYQYVPMVRNDSTGA